MFSLITRTIIDDYRCFGRIIDCSWIKDYGIGNLDPESSTNLPLSVLVFIKKDKTWEGRISWFPSKRKDRIGTHIRYAIIGKGKIGDEDSHLFLSFINYFINSIENNESKEKQKEFGKKLDEYFTEEKLNFFLKEDSTYCEEELKKVINKSLMELDFQKEENYPFMKIENESILYVNNLAKLHEGYNLLVSDLDIPFDTLVVYNSNSFDCFENLIEKKAAGVIYIESNNIYENGQLKKDLKDYYNFDCKVDISNNKSLVCTKDCSEKKINL